MSTGSVLSHITFALALFLLLPTGRLSWRERIATLAGTALLSLIPVDGLSLAEYMRSLVNELSMTSLLLLGWCAGARVLGRRAMPESRHLQLALCFSLLALLLYPAALGLSMFDPYRLGYAPRHLLVLIFCLTLGFWLVRHYFGAALLTAVTVIYLLDWRSPDNYWDYLIDPLLGLYALILVGSQGLRWVWRKRQLASVPRTGRPAGENRPSIS